MPASTQASLIALTVVVLFSVLASAMAQPVPEREQSSRLIHALEANTRALEANTRALQR